MVLGCALEGGLLLALFATAGVLEAQLAGSARGDLKALWASVPKTANAVQVYTPIRRLHPHTVSGTVSGSILSQLSISHSANVATPLSRVRV